MGCGSSKEKVCQNCQAPYVPVKRAYSMHSRHPSHNTEDSCHLVSLTSSTLGSLKIDPLILRNRLLEDEDECVPSVVEDKFTIKDRKIGSGKTAAEQFMFGMIEAKTWSKMISERIPKILPKTPIRTPPGEPEMINTWEMMEGLEDISPPRPVHHFRSFSFHVPRNSSLSSSDDHQTPRAKENVNGSPKPFWLDSCDSDSNSNSNDTSVVSEFDPEVIATFRKSLEDLPPADPFYLKPLNVENQPALAGMGYALEAIDEKNSSKDILTNKVESFRKERLIIYFTSLRSVRKTYEDCCNVQVILKGLGVKVDERDVSMHSRFKDELKELLKDGIGRGGLPRVFMGKTYIGGAEEIRRLNEDGHLQNLVKNCEFMSDGSGGIGNACEACGDIRFVPCETCSGSCKIFYEEEYYDENENPYGFQRCPDCNENGLILCPVCSD